MPHAKLLDYTGDGRMDGIILAVGTVTVLIAFTWRDLVSMIMQRYYHESILPRLILAVLLTVAGYFFIRWSIRVVEKADAQATRITIQ